jgi:septal ring factor EnvC (AmiA/AmiB activator)
LAEESLLSVARSINLIKFLKGDLEKKGSELNTKLTTLSALKKELSTEGLRYRLASANLSQENQNLSDLMNKKKFLFSQKKLKNLTAKNNLFADKGLPLNLNELLKSLQHNRAEKEKAVITLKKFSKNISIQNNLVKGTLDNILPFEDNRNAKYLTEKHLGLTSSRSFYKNKLNIRLPVAGKIIKLFGKPDLIGLTAKGITIATRAGANVVATFDGKVLYAGPFRKYGKILIITHGEGFSSLLIGMSHIHVKTGQDLLGGEPVGVMTKSSNTGTKLNQRLYIELRKHGKPIDPMAWLSLNRNAT